MSRAGQQLLIVLALAAFFWRSHAAAGSGGACALQDCSACSSGLFCLSSDTAGSGDGSGQCNSCHRLCTECYGPSNNECFNCTSLFMLLEETTSIGCQNPSSTNQVMCVDECPRDTVLSGKRCVCRNGTYQVGSGCVSCLPGCEQCVNGTQAGCLTMCQYVYMGQCMSQCPPGTVAGGSTCTKLLLPFENFWLYVIIGGGAALIIFIVFLCLSCILCCCCCCKRKRKGDAPITSDGNLRHNTESSHGTMSASFRLVPHTNTASRWRRSERIDAKVSQTSMQDQVYLQSVDKSLDPYSSFNQSASNGNSQTSHTSAEAEERTRLDSSYVQMLSIKTAEEQLMPPPTHLPTGRTHSDIPPSSYQPASSNINKTSTMPAAVAAFDEEVVEEQEEYIDPRDLIENSNEEYYYNHEFIEKFRKGSQSENYEVPRDLGYGSQTHPDNVPHPSIPPRGVVCATSSQQAASAEEDAPLERHDTLDNEYVKMRPQIDKMMREQELAAHSYINVENRKAGRSVTLPHIVNQPPPPPHPPPPEEDDDSSERPVYYNVHHRSQPIEDAIYD